MPDDFDDTGTRDAMQPDAPGGTVEFPDPAACAKSPNIAGVPATLGDGKTWLLAWDGLKHVPAAYRDSIYADVILRGSLNVAEARAAAYLLLRANYAMEEADAVALVLASDPGEYCDAVVEAMLSSEPAEKTWTAWARSALLVNGIDPDAIRPSDLPAVLYTLVVTGKAKPHQEWTDAGVAGAKLARYRGIAQRLAPTPAASAAAPGPQAEGPGLGQ